MEASAAIPETFPGQEENLPYCHSRREHDTASRVYFCVHPQVHTEGNLVEADICTICEKPHEPPPETFRELTNVVRHGPCRFLGEQVGLRDCPTCRGNVKVKVFQCVHPKHESTTINECVACADYERRPANASTA